MDTTTLLALLLAGSAGPALDTTFGQTAPTAGVRLKADAADASTLLMFAFADSGRLLLAKPGVGSPVTLDVTRPTMDDLEDEVVVASGAPELTLGRVIFVADQARLDAAAESTLRPMLEKGGSKTRKVKLLFRGIRITSLLGLLADVGKRQLAVTEEVDGLVVVATGGRPWAEVMDALLVSTDLTRDEVDGVIRIRRRGDNAPKFTPLEVRLKQRVGGAEPPALTGACKRVQGQHELATIRLVATLTGGPGPVALLELPGGKPAIVRAGDCIGSDGGQVVRVEPGNLVVERPRSRPDGTAGVEQVFMRMRRG